MVVDKISLKEGEMLVKRHERMITAVDKALKESASFGEGLNQERKMSLAIMLDNVSKCFDANAPRVLTESGTQVVDIAKKNEYLNLVAAVMPTLVAEDVVSVQPLKQKAGVVYYMKHIYDSNRGQIQAGDNISNYIQVGPDANKIPNAFDYSAERIEGEEIVPASDNKSFTLAWLPVVPGSVTFNDGTYDNTDDGEGHIIANNSQVGTIDYATGLVSFTSATTVTDNLVSYAQDLFVAPVNAPAIKTVIADVTITARPRKLKTGFSMDAAFDLSATQNIDLQTLLQATATDEIRAEIDGEILNDLGNSGTTMSVSFNMPVPFGINKHDHYESFYQVLVAGANKVYQKTRRVTPNIVIVGENAANIIETMDKFVAAPSLNTAGPHIMGTLNKRFLIVKNPYYASNKFTIVYRGDVTLDTGFVYAPYMPITATQFILGSDFYGHQGYATSYGKKLVAPEFFCNGLITEVNQ
jgi:hypothetical protein